MTTHCVSSISHPSQKNKNKMALNQISCINLFALFVSYLLSRDYQIEKLNPWYRPYTQGNPSKLFLDMVPSFCEDSTPAMRGQPTQLSRNQKKKRNSGKFGESFYMF